MNSVLEYLKDKEWSMGNGQCPDCCGAPPMWLGHPCHLTTNTIGHKQDCPLAAALLAAGGSPLMIGEYKGGVVNPRYLPGSILSQRREAGSW